MIFFLGKQEPWISGVLLLLGFDLISYSHSIMMFLRIKAWLTRIQVSIVEAVEKSCPNLVNA
jgi:hypothetical protein